MIFGLLEQDMCGLGRKTLAYLRDLELREWWRAISTSQLQLVEAETKCKMQTKSNVVNFFQKKRSGIKLCLMRPLFHTVKFQVTSVNVVPHCSAWPMLPPAKPIPHCWWMTWCCEGSAVTCLHPCSLYTDVATDSLNHLMIIYDYVRSSRRNMQIPSNRLFKEHCF